MKLFNSIKEFYVDNMKLVNGFVLNQLALSVFGFMVCIAMSEISETVSIITSILASLFFCSLLYDSAWTEGDRDRNRVSNGRLPLRPLHGAKVALFAYIPTFIFLIPGLITNILNIFGITVFDTLNLICKAILMIFGFGTYLGITYSAIAVFITPGEFDYVSMFVFAACTIPAIVSYALGYRLGLADIQLKTLIGMKPSLGEGAYKNKGRKK